MEKYKVENGKCLKLIFRKKVWNKLVNNWIYPKKAKAFAIWVDTDCHFCGTCG